MMHRALIIDVDAYGFYHPRVANDQSNLAQVVSIYSPQDAEKLLRSALKIDEKCFGRTHLAVAIRLNNLAELLFKTTRKTDAEPLLKRAHGIVIQSLKPEHPTAQSISANYLAVLQSLGKSPAEIQALMAPPAT